MKKNIEFRLGVILFLAMLIVLVSEEINAQVLTEIEGPLKIGTDINPTPSEGTIRYNGNDLECFLNGSWISLTANTNQQTTYVTNEQELRDAINANKAHIVLANDFTVANSVIVQGPVNIESIGTSKTISGNNIFTILGEDVLIKNINFIGSNQGTAIALSSGFQNVHLEKLNFDSYAYAIHKGGGASSSISNILKMYDITVTNSVITGDNGAVKINWNVENIFINNMLIDGSTGEGLEITNGCNGQINNLQVLNINRTGFELWNTTNSTNPYHSFEISNVSARNCNLWGVSLHSARVTATNLTTHNTVGFGIEIVGSGSSYDYKPVQISNILISGVRRNGDEAFGISLDKHAGANISNFHIEGLETNPETGVSQDTYGIQVRLSEHFTIHDGQFVNCDRGVMLQGGNQLARDGSVMNNRFLNCGNLVFNNGSNIDSDNNISW